ncbi:O-antigen polymerase [Mitsuokella multacida]|uniref:O-antigen polymerase n=1 Tax=Mitsuokella multacida TaxID=52226 RepID=UPI001F27889A|nr:O-antigen polymerase [Mitsuokella multacida]
MLYLLTFMIFTCIVFYNTYLNKEPLAPPVVFALSIFISCFVAIFYEDFYYLDLGIDTFLTILCGVLTFFCGYIIYGEYYQKNNRDIVLSSSRTIPITINNKGYFIILIINVLTVVLTYIFLMHTSAVYGGMSLSERIFSYRVSYMFNEDLRPEELIPWYTNVLHDISYASVLWMGYIWLVNINLLNKKFDGRFFLVLGLYFLSTLLSGGRANIVYIFLALGVIFYILKMETVKWSYSFSIKQILKSIIIGFLSIAIFFLSTIAIGRGDSIVDLDTFLNELYLGVGVYIAAPIKLLDLFVTEEYVSDNGMPIGFYTFHHIYNWLGLHLGIKDWYQAEDFGFRSVNGVFLGNVYTTFKPYYQDFGLIGVVFLCFLMGVIFAYVYYRIKYMRKKSEYISRDTWIVIYAFLFYSIALASFYNWFYEYFFDTWFFKMMIYFYIVKKMLGVSDSKCL